MSGLIVVLVVAVVVALAAAEDAAQRPMLAILRSRVGRWVCIQLRTSAVGVVGAGRLVSVDAHGFVLELLDGRQTTYQVRPREVLCVVDLPHQEALQAQWAEHQQAQAAAGGVH